MIDISFVDFKDAIIERAKRPENIAEDGSVIWNYVEADMFTEGKMDEDLRKPFDFIVTGFKNAGRNRSMKDLEMEITEFLVESNGEVDLVEVAEKFNVPFEDVMFIAESLEEV